MKGGDSQSITCSLFYYPFENYILIFIVSLMSLQTSRFSGFVTFMFSIVSFDIFCQFSMTLETIVIDLDQNIVLNTLLVAL